MARRPEERREKENPSPSDVLGLQSSSRERCGNGVRGNCASSAGRCASSAQLSACFSPVTWDVRARIKLERESSWRSQQDGKFCAASGGEQRRAAAALVDREPAGSRAGGADGTRDRSRAARRRSLAFLSLWGKTPRFLPLPPVTVAFNLEREKSEKLILGSGKCCRWTARIGGIPDLSAHSLPSTSAFCCNFDFFASNIRASMWQNTVENEEHSKWKCMRCTPGFENVSFRSAELHALCTPPTAACFELGAMDS